jgi:hypothetical protein
VNVSQFGNLLQMQVRDNDPGSARPATSGHGIGLKRTEGKGD